MSNLFSYVAAVLNHKIVIKCNDKKKFSALKELGAERKFGFGTKWYLVFEKDDDLAEKFCRLRNEGFFFSYDQHGWGPSDIMRLLKEKNLIKGSFIEVFWKGPNMVETREI
jgi:hypothetical protein